MDNFELEEKKLLLEIADRTKLILNTGRVPTNDDMVDLVSMLSNLDELPDDCSYMRSHLEYEFEDRTHEICLWERNKDRCAYSSPISYIINLANMTYGTALIPEDHGWDWKPLLSA